MIRVHELDFTYPHVATPAVSRLSFSVEHGEIFGFLGPSGAGKSTTQKILIGLLRGYAGEVEVFDRPLAGWGPEYYERVGVSFELPNHFLRLTATENLTYFGALYGGPTRQPREVLELVGLENDAKLLVGQFSKGMKNRLTIARALLHNPELLFLDEPTSGLDPVNSRRVKELIRAQKQAGKTVFLTTHDMTVADELCDRVAFIVDGQIRAINTPRELKLCHGRPTVRVEHQNGNKLNQQEFPLENLGDNQAFLDLLRTGSVQTLHSQEATLEDVFVQLTGRSLV